MKLKGKQIFFYIFRSILPYTAFAWLLLTVILFIQQAGRYSDLLFGTTLPGSLFWQLAIALLPNVVSFTSPMAVLVGVIVGLSRLREDSELTALYAAGIGNFRISQPVILLGFLLTCLGFWVNLQGVPIAAKQVKGIILQATAIKLESPIEPGSFNTNLNGFVVYVKQGDKINGLWEKVFAVSEGTGGATQTRLITAESGKLDSGGTDELVLKNAVITTLPKAISENTKAGEFIQEKVDNLRFTLKTKRQELTEKLAKQEETPEELGLIELSQLAQNKDGKEKIEAQLLFWRKITLSLTPLIFAWLALGLTLLFNQIGRGSGGALALGVLILYYLLTLAGEQIARTGLISVWLGSLVPICLAILVGGLAFSQSRKPRQSLFKLPSFRKQNTDSRVTVNKTGLNWRSGILDRDFAGSILKFSFLTLVSLICIYLIFTVFELWKFVITHNNGIWLLTKYLYFLVPLVVLQIFPSAFMVGIITAYTLKSRRHELIAWTAAGQSVYRLLIPCFIVAFAFGLFGWFLQEQITPYSNRKQDAIRIEIRGNSGVYNESKKFWFANKSRIFSFDVINNNSKRFVNNLKIYEFDPERFLVNKIYSSGKASFDDGKLSIWENPKLIDLSKTGEISTTEIGEKTFDLDVNPFGQIFTKPTHLTTGELRDSISLSKIETEKRSLSVYFEKRFITPILPVCIMLFVAPFAIQIGRKRRVISIAMSIALWLLFMASSNFIENLGIIGILSPFIASWLPIILFSALGFILVSRVKT